MRQRLEALVRMMCASLVLAAVENRMRDINYMSLPFFHTRRGILHNNANICIRQKNDGRTN